MHFSTLFFRFRLRKAFTSTFYKKWVFFVKNGRFLIISIIFDNLTNILYNVSKSRSR